MIQTPKYSCNDDPFSDGGGSEPTCGWQIDPETGARLPYSHGFCCECDLLNLMGEVTATRGSDCDLINVGSTASSAHCLKFSEADSWYKANTMQPPKMRYTIELFFSLPITNTDDDTLSFMEEKI